MATFGATGYRLQPSVVYSVQSPASNLKMPSAGPANLANAAAGFRCGSLSNLRKPFPWQLSEPQATGCSHLSKLPFAGPQTTKMPLQALQTLQTLPQAFRCGSLSNPSQAFSMATLGATGCSHLFFTAAVCRASNRQNVFAGPANLANAAASLSLR